jgi:hypothetical protein
MDLARAGRATADLVSRDGRIATQDLGRSFTEAVAPRGGRIVAVGSDAEEIPRPPSGRSEPNVMAYPVTTHCNSAGEKDRSR